MGKMEKYEKLIENLFKANEWLMSKGYADWDEIKGFKPYDKYNRLLEEVCKLQEELHEEFDLKNNYNDKLD